MQNELDDGTSLYHEYTDPSGFVVREIPRSQNPQLRFQVGQYKNRPMSLPVYQADRMTHHVQGTDVRVFHILGFAEKRMQALDNASNYLLRKDIENQIAKA